MTPLETLTVEITVVALAVIALYLSTKRSRKSDKENQRDDDLNQNGRISSLEGHMHNNRDRMDELTIEVKNRGQKRWQEGYDLGVEHGTAKGKLEILDNRASKLEPETSGKKKR